MNASVTEPRHAYRRHTRTQCWLLCARRSLQVTLLCTMNIKYRIVFFSHETRCILPLVGRAKSPMMSVVAFCGWLRNAKEFWWPTRILWYDHMDWSDNFHDVVGVTDNDCHAGLDWPLFHCAMAQAPPFDEHRRPLVPSKFFDNNDNNFSWPSALSVII